MNPTTPEAVADGEKTTDSTTGKATAGTDRVTAENPEQRDRDETGPGAGTPDDRTADTDADDTDAAADDLDDADDADEASSGRLAAASAAVVSAGLGVVALTGAWSGRVAAERETLIGQIKTSSGGSAAQQINEIYGDAWHATALVNGLFGLLALLVGTYVLVRPAFGAPARQPQAGWVRAVARGGIALGALGVLISVAMYFDLIVALPTTAG
ncbi:MULTISPECIES: hypothetical protein [unclassified Streptomyces]|uniref:hypothetical protein n=1 Tax=unclassified Streptomyces TaxID=2593676 RepID=UPI002ED533A7|nr:hypothetical protein OH827_24300 [Streptomyces sp. NBC_00891]WSY07942.1 hypothetical protein OG464_24300 [Streptomyces sp. NBC_00890]WSZ09568.1 hypothetical protein OG704_24305 [Streptomyces sp. NBC_00869]WSZ22933.1 hypothetical protein OG498_09265 [Streptomyces sp. NBC_00870]